MVTSSSVDLQRGAKEPWDSFVKVISGTGIAIFGHMIDALGRC